jgi:thiosulfate/3-mercaptopyruvate sulfurtransferase
VIIQSLIPYRIRAGLALSLVTIGAATACAQGTATSDPELGTARVVVSVPWLADHLGDSNLVVLAIGRAPEDFAVGHIPGAVYIDLDEIRGTRGGIPSQLAADALLIDVFEAAGVSDDSRIIVYGAPLDAARLFYTLEYVGLDRVSVLDGGLAAWAEGGGAIATSPVAVTRGTITSQPDRSVSVDGDWVSERLDANGIALVDARSPEEFSGDRLSRGTERPGHIPGASNLPWDRLLVSPQMPLLREPADLERLLTDAGVAPGDTVVTYCRTGMRAAVVYLAARALGYETVLYDASYLEWSARPELPVTR